MYDFYFVCRDCRDRVYALSKGSGVGLTRRVYRFFAAKAARRGMRLEVTLDGAPLGGYALRRIRPL